MLASVVWIDWALAAIVLVSALISLKRGFFREALSLVIWVMAVVISLMFHEQLAVWLQPYVDSPSLRKVCAIAGLFTLCLLLGGLVSFIVAQLIKMTGLTGMDRLLGMIFGALRGVIVVVVLLMVVQQLLPVTQEIWWQHSLLIPHFLRLENWTVSVAFAIRDLIMPLLQWQ